MPVCCVADRTRSASWPIIAYTSLAGTTLAAVRITCSSSGLPPTSCNTLGSCDLSRVPLPAAMIATAIRGGTAGDVRNVLREETVDFRFDFFIRPQYTLLARRWLFPYNLPAQPEHPRATHQWRKHAEVCD